MYFPLLLQSAFAYGESHVRKGKQPETPFSKRGLATLPKQGHLRFGGANASPRALFVLTLTPSCALCERTLRGGFCF